MADPDHKPSRIKGARKKRKAGLIVTAINNEPEEQAIARAFLDPLVLAGSFLADVNKRGPNEFVAEIRKHAQAVTAGNLSRLEQMLTAQAHTLDGLFYSLVNRSRANSTAGYVDAGEAYMKLALRAQSQCRATAESIATIKNPPTLAFVRQANIAAGPQQINNGVAQAAQPPRAEQIGSRPIKLESQNGERLDTRAASSAAGIDSTLETVGAIDRTANGGG